MVSGDSQTGTPAFAGFPMPQQDYREFIVSYNTALFRELSSREDVYIKNIDNQWMILYYPADISPDPSQVLYLQTPKAYAPTVTATAAFAPDAESSAPRDISGITRVQGQRGLMLRGQGTLIGIIDSGIDYTNPLFTYARGLSKIEALWDQTTDTVYDNAAINEALRNAAQGVDPLSIVPSTDTDGSGTFLAGIACASTDTATGFCGAAPDAGLLVVKLRPLSKYLRDYYLIRDDAAAYSEADIMLGLEFLLKRAQDLGKPLSICLGLGGSMGPHTSGSPLTAYALRLSSYVNTSVTIPVGNEGNARRHYNGIVHPDRQYDAVEMYVADNNKGFMLELWAEGADLFSIGLTSPLGETIPRLPARNQRGGTTISPALEDTVIQVDYDTVDNASGNEVIRMRFQTPTPGIWKLQVYGLSGLTGRFNLWLPVTDFLTSECYFLRPSPDTTLTQPSAGSPIISVGAYDHRTGGLYIESGRGPTADGIIKPDLVAPGVNITGPAKEQKENSGITYTVSSGTGIAAAYVAGAVSLMYSAEAYEEEPEYPSQATIKSRLVRGADRSTRASYPNIEFGYGTLNAYGAVSQSTLQ